MLPTTITPAEQEKPTTSTRDQDPKLWTDRSEIEGTHIGPERKELEDTHGLGVAVARDRESRAELAGSYPRT